jgi:hypothetical protein
MKRFIFICLVSCMLVSLLLDDRLTQMDCSFLLFDWSELSLRRDLLDLGNYSCNTFDYSYRWRRVERDIARGFLQECP